MKKGSRTENKEDQFASLVNQLSGNSWLEGVFGLEKENIRVDKTGKLSQSPHPKVFGEQTQTPLYNDRFF